MKKVAVSTKKIKSQKKQIINWLEWGLVVVAVVLVVSVVRIFLKSGLPFGHDVVVDVTRVKVMVEAISDGQIPARWVGWAYGGAGAPMFNFYEPGFFYVAGGVSLLAGAVSWGVKMTMVGLWLVAAVGVWIVFRRQGRLVPVAAVLSYMFSPYVVATVMVRGSWPEFMALAVLPWLWWGLDRLIVKADKRYFLAIAVTVALMMISHWPTSVIGGVFLAGYGWWLWRDRGSSREVLVTGCMAMGMGLLLSAFYWLPALMELSMIQNEWLLYGVYDFRVHFVALWQLVKPGWGYGISRIGTDDGMSFFVGVWQMLMIIVLGLVLVVGKWVRKWVGEDIGKYRGLLIWMAVCVVGAVFLMTSLSVTYWEVYDVLKWLGHPWRLGMVLTLVATMMTVLVMKWMKKDMRVYVLGVLVGISIVMWVVAKPSRYIEENIVEVNDGWSYDQSRVVDVEEGYLPITSVATASARPAIAVIDGDMGVRKKLFEKADELQAVIAATTSGVIEINRYDYPGWEVRVGEEKVEHKVTKEGLLRVKVSEGESLVTVKFTRTWWRWVAEMITLVTVFLVAVVWWRWRRK